MLTILNFLISNTNKQKPFCWTCGMPTTKKKTEPQTMFKSRLFSTLLWLFILTRKKKKKNKKNKPKFFETKELHFNQRSHIPMSFS